MKHASINSQAGARDYAFKSLGIENVFFTSDNEFEKEIILKKIKSSFIEKPLENEFFLNEKIDILSFCENKKEENNEFITEKFTSILQRKKPKWFIWEGSAESIYSDNGQRFKSLIGSFNEIGYGVSWRVFDSQFFRSPREDRRMYVVGYFGAWEPTREVLFEQGSLIGCLERKQSTKKIDRKSRVEISGKENKVKISIHGKIPENRLRVLTPIEMERSKGLPDNWTKIKYKNNTLKNCPDKERYKSLFNSSNANVYKFLAKRILVTEKVILKKGIHNEN